MFVSKKKYLESKAAHARDVAVLEIEIRELQSALDTSLAAAKVALQNERGRTVKAEKALERYLADYVAQWKPVPAA